MLSLGRNYICFASTRLPVKQLVRKTSFFAVVKCLAGKIFSKITRNELDDEPYCIIYDWWHREGQLTTYCFSATEKWHITAVHIWALEWGWILCKRRLFVYCSFHNCIYVYCSWMQARTWHLSVYKDVGWCKWMWKSRQFSAVHRALTSLMFWNLLMRMKKRIWNLIWVCVAFRTSWEGYSASSEMRIADLSICHLFCIIQW